MNKYSQHAIRGKTERLEMIENSRERLALMEMDEVVIHHHSGGKQRSLWTKLTNGPKLR